jgi:AraC family transcriptional regulator
MRRLFRRNGAWTPRSRARVEEVCFEVLLSLARDAAASRPEPPPWLVSVRETLRTRCDEAPRVQDLAADAGVHPVHLIRSFRRFFGVTPREFLREHRLSVAMRLLTSTSLPIAEIAQSSGFADQSHFTRAFRRVHALPPGAFRRHQLTGRTKAG